MSSIADAGRSGEIVRGRLRVGSLADSTPINLPYSVATGRSDGPTVWLQAGIHGEEYGGSAAIVRFMRELDPATLKGRIVALPVVNPPSFNFRSRVSSIDGHNLNRIFPGDPGGTYSQQLAAVLRDALAATADCLLDLHSGGIGAEVPFYAIFKDNGSPTVARSKELAKGVGCGILWRAEERDGLGKTMTAEAIRLGIPCVTIECGGGTFTERHMEDYLTAIRGFMQAAGVLPGEAPRQERYTIVSGGTFLHNRAGGLFVPACRAGDFVAEGAAMGRMIDLYGDTVEEIVSPHDNAFVAALRCNHYPVHAGEIVGEAVPVESHES